MSTILDWFSRVLERWLKNKFIFPAHTFSEKSTTLLTRDDHGVKILLHVGCGGATKIDAGPGFQSDHWREVRMDIDPSANPDIVGSVLDMSMVPDESVDGVYSSHTLEHLYAHEIPLALDEMRRVLKLDGIVLVTVPDLQQVARLIVDDKLNEPVYISPSGPICPIDILYGHRSSLARGNFYMAHRSGFTLTTFIEVFREAGFRSVVGIGREDGFDLWVFATVLPMEDEKLDELAAQYFPV